MSKQNSPLKQLQEQLQVVDILFEVRDARIPQTSAHPNSQEIFSKKQRVLVLAKNDLADIQALSIWQNSNKSDTTPIINLSLKFTKNKDSLIKLALSLCKDKLEKRKSKGLLTRPLRVSVVGLPNVGKSSLINWLIGRNKAKVANTPGVTRGNSWIRIHPEIELLDTPGILPQISFSGEAALKLALCNILPAEHYDSLEVAEYGLNKLSQLYSKELNDYLKIDQDSQIEASLSALASKRKFLAQGGKLDIHRAAHIFLSEFRQGKIAKVVLD